MMDIVSYSFQILSLVIVYVIYIYYCRSIGFPDCAKVRFMLFFMVNLLILIAKIVIIVFGESAIHKIALNSGISFIFQALSFILLKPNKELVQLIQFDYIKLFSNNHFLTEIYMPSIFANPIWSSLPVSEQLQLYNAYKNKKDKPAQLDYPTP